MVMSYDPQFKWRELASWRELLAPWLTAMRRAGLSLKLPALHTVSDRKNLWFSMDLPSDPKEWHDVVKGMEMIDLVARVDRDCAWRLLFENAGNHAKRLLPLYGEMLWNTVGTQAFPQYEIKVYSVNSRNQIDLNHLYHVVANDETDTSYEKSVKGMLMARVNDTFPGERVLNRRIDGFVQLRLNAKLPNISSNGIKYVLREVASVARGLEHQSDSKFPGVYPRRNADRGVFKCHSYRIKFCGGPLKDEAVQALLSLRTLAAPLTHIKMPPMWFSQLQIDATSFVLSAQKRLRVGMLDDMGVCSFFTAVADSESLPEMEFVPGFVDPNEPNATVLADPNLAKPEVYWPWLAYAIFSSKAHHKATAVKICIHGLTYEQVGMMEEVLIHKDPLELLKQTENGGVIPTKEPNMCWPEPLRPAPWAHTIRHLSISSSGSLGISLCSLLSIVGGPITRLSLSEIVDAPWRHLILDAVFIHCPKLQHLDLDKLIVDSLDWFKYRYRLCHKLETLSIGEIVATEGEASSWTGLFTALSDPAHALAMTLRQLHVNLAEVALVLPIEDQITTYETLVRMLEVNQKLERVEVAQCPLWVVQAYKDRVPSNTTLEVASAAAVRRISGFFPATSDRLHEFY